MKSQRSHIVLVPGFGGFDVLGSLRYYHGVTEVLRAAGLVVHYFPNLPLASVDTRARALREWLIELQRRGIFEDGDDLHLVGHSTGGLDLRMLLHDLAADPRDDGPRRGLLDAVRTAQFLSTPHCGTNLAFWTNGWLTRFLFAHAILGTSYGTTRALGEQGLGRYGQLLRRVLRSDEEPDWIDAIVDTMALCYPCDDPLKRARARASYFDLLKWLRNAMRDQSVMGDLDPEPGKVVSTSPAHWEGRSEAKDEQVLFAKHEIRVRSIVTVAPPPSGALPRNVYELCYALTSLDGSNRIASRASVRIPKLFEPNETMLLRPSDNDGIVNSISMIWPYEEASFAVEGDHGDVMGHFRSPSADERKHEREDDRTYDLFQSGSCFDEASFRTLWNGIALFARECGQSGAALRAA
ncbi:hypothetical protein [Polyangium sp. y55x31]|uniref:esterase/lipase family protein n=1 Tax=Polyangium sp. y55x31 TaxID=3042688 RepID=UPI002482EECC|nr:hypothetical protein [Polyangium sp. y55x31]MDI1483408.1 hypothetical protein [Polyangium sp. y55x31]